MTREIRICKACLLYGPFGPGVPGQGQCFLYNVVSYELYSGRKDKVSETEECRFNFSPDENLVALLDKDHKAVIAQVLNRNERDFSKPIEEKDISPFFVIEQKHRVLDPGSLTRPFFVAAEEFYGKPPVAKWRAVA